MLDKGFAQKAGSVTAFPDPEKIRQAKQEWESAVDSMPQIICVLDGLGRIIRVNRSSEYWGLRGVAEVRGLTLHKLLHPSCTRESCGLRDFWPLAKTELRQGRRARYDADDASLERYIKVMVRPTRFVGEGPATDTDVFAIAVVDDITDLKQKEARLLRQTDELGARVRARTVELQQAYQQLVQEIEERSHIERAQARLLTILQRTPDFVSVTDANMVPLYVNPAGRKMVHIGYDEDVSRVSIAALHPPHVAKMLEEVAVPAALRDGIWVGESALIGRGGDTIPVSQVIIVHRSPEGRLEGFSTILRDMTQRQRAEDALRELSAQRLTVQEIERKRIAADLHDGLGQSLSVLKFCVEDALRLIAEKSTGEAEDVLRRLVGKIGESVGEVRRITMDLRPSTLDDLGILATMSWFAREFQRVYHGIAVEQEIGLLEKDVPGPLKTTLYRILQEAMNNIAKHAQADRINVALLKIDHRIELRIRDNGVGFDMAEVGARRGAEKGFGLVGMQDRVSLSAGTFEIESALERGTTIRVSWPAG